MAGILLWALQDRKNTFERHENASLVIVDDLMEKIFAVRKGKVEELIEMINENLAGSKDVSNEVRESVNALKYQPFRNSDELVSALDQNDFSYFI